MVDQLVALLLQFSDLCISSTGASSLCPAGGAETSILSNFKRLNRVFAIFVFEEAVVASS